MTDLDVDTRERLSWSNIPASVRASQERIIVDGCRQEGIRPSDIFAFTMVDVYRKPDGSSMGTEPYLMGVLPKIGLMLFREKGGVLRARQVDVQTALFSELPGLGFCPEDN